MGVQTFLDGTEVTGVVLNGSATRRLNRPSQAECRISVEDAIGNVGSRLKVVVNGNLFFHGMCLNVSDEADENVGYTVYQATDPMELWNWRPARDGAASPTPGNLITPSFFTRNLYGPLIMQEILTQSQVTDQSIGEGPLFITLGTIAGGSLHDLSGAPTNFPMTIAEIAALLTSTGVVDIVLTPIDSGGNMASVSVYNGDYGTNRTGSVSFDYAGGANNVRSVRQVQDMSNMSNKLQYFLGPKETIERYKGNIVATDPCLPVQVGAGPTAALLSLRASSQSTYGVRMEIQEFDVDVVSREQQPLGTCVALDPVRMIFRRLWFAESWIRAQPRRLVHLTPVRGVGIGAFDIGDTVSVSAGSYLRGGFSGAQRIYEYTINWDTEGVMELTELVTSPNNEGV